MQVNAAAEQDLLIYNYELRYTGKVETQLSILQQVLCLTDILIDRSCQRIHTVPEMIANCSGCLLGYRSDGTMTQVSHAGEEVDFDEAYIFPPTR